MKSGFIIVILKHEINGFRDPKLIGFKLTGQQQKHLGNNRLIGYLLCNVVAKNCTCILINSTLRITNILQQFMNK